MFDLRITIMNLKDKYKLAKAAKVGESVTCPSCGFLFVKLNYQQAFCKSKAGTQCKDAYWNTIVPTKRNNTTRISPASARWTARREAEREFNNFDEDQSWDAHKSY